MNPIDYCKGIETKLIAWKAKMYDLTRKIAIRGSEERENVLINIQDLNMPITETSSLAEQLKTVLPTEMDATEEKYRQWLRRDAQQICAAASAFVDRALR